MILDKLKSLIAEQLAVDPDIITMDTSFEDLNVDSVDIVELSMAMEMEFDMEEMTEEELGRIITVGDLVNHIQHKLDL